MTSIESQNKKLKGVLPENYARPELEKHRLGEVIYLQILSFMEKKRKILWGKHMNIAYRCLQAQKESVVENSIHLLAL